MADTYTSDKNDTSQIIRIKAADQGDGTFAWAEVHGAKVVSPADQATVSNVLTDWVGSTLDTLNYYSVSYNIVNSGANSITWRVLGANLADFSDAQIVKVNAAVAAAATDTYSAGPAVYRYYKVQVMDTVNGSHGTAHGAGIAKG